MVLSVCACRAIELLLLCWIFEIMTLCLILLGSRKMRKRPFLDWMNDAKIESKNKFWLQFVSISNGWYALTQFQLDSIFQWITKHSIILISIQILFSYSLNLNCLFTTIQQHSKYINYCFMSQVNTKEQFLNVDLNFEKR